MTVGKVKWFSDDKGYGFIEVDGREKDIFVHYSDITGEGFRSLEEGVAVEFEIEAGDSGDRAKNVVRAGGDSAGGDDAGGNSDGDG